MASSDAEPVVRSTTDAAAFLDVVAPLVEQDPIQHSVLATNLARLLAAGDPSGDPSGAALWIWVQRKGRTVAAAMHTPPHPPHVPVSDPSEAAAVAEHLARSGRAITGVGGPRPAAEAFARRWQELRGARASVRMQTGVYALHQVVHPVGVPGRLRLAEPADESVVNAWAQAFAATVGEPAVPADSMSGRVRDRELWVWDDDGPVSMAYASPAHGKVSRVSWVYTPPGLRGRGYASACVAGVSEEQVSRGHQCMLYADLANPTSTAIYQRLGYRLVAESVRMDLEDP